MHTNYSWIDINDLFFCVCLFAVQEMEERIHHFETFLWAGKARQVDPDQLGTTKTHKLNHIANHTEKHARTGEVGCPPIFFSPQGGNAFQLRIHRCYRLRNLARSRPILHNQTSGGASVTHARARPRGDGQPLVLLGCLPLSMLLAASPKSHDWRNQQIGWCHIATWPVHTRALSLSSEYFGKRTHFPIFTSRNVNAECHWEMRSGRLRRSGPAALFLLSDCNYLIEKSEPVENGLQSSSRNTKLLRSSQRD